MTDHNGMNHHDECDYDPRDDVPFCDECDDYVSEDCDHADSDAIDEYVADVAAAYFA